MPAGALAATAPAVVGATSNATNLSGVISVAVSGSNAFATAYWPGQLTSVDISDPLHPSVVGATAATTSLQNGSNVAIDAARSQALVVSKNRNASMLSNDDGSGNAMTAVDISTPGSPTPVSPAVHDAAHLFGSYGIA